MGLGEPRWTFLFIISLILKPERGKIGYQSGKEIKWQQEVLSASLNMMVL
jgi:hypothetical protein